MVKTGTSSSKYAYPAWGYFGLQKLAEQLEAAHDLEQDIRELKKIGLNDIELAGYTEFFLENYYIKPLWRVQHG